jgi:Na+-driven multidrug efflux pump
MARGWRTKVLLATRGKWILAMKDLTRGSIAGHILTMAPPIVAGMITIMICQLVDLYFVAGLGEAAVAGVAAAGNAGFLINGFM